MALKALKKLKEDLESGDQAVVADYATTAGNAGTAYKATSAGNAGTSRIAHYASSGTAALAGTNVIFATGL